MRPVDAVPTPAPVVAPVAAPIPAAQSLPAITPKMVKPRRSGEDLDRPATRKEIKEANEILALGKDRGTDIDTAEGVRELRRDILEGRFGATKQRKRELGLLSDDRIRPESKSKKIKFKTRYTKEEFEKYLETARLLAERDGR